MRKVTRKSLDELAKVMPVISEVNQRKYVGGGSGSTGDIPPGPLPDGGWTPPPPPVGPLGSSSNPYSIDIAIGLMDAGHWQGGYVEGWGYVSREVGITGNVPSNDSNGSSAGHGNGISGSSSHGYNDGYIGGYGGNSDGGYVGGYGGTNNGNGGYGDSYGGGYGYGGAGNGNSGYGDSYIGGYGSAGNGYGGNGDNYVGGYGGGYSDNYVGGYGGGSTGGSGGGGGGSINNGGNSGGKPPYMPGNGLTGNCLGDSYPHDGSLTDGVNVENTRNFTFNTSSQSVFNEQLINILKSNSVIKGLLSYFDKGIVHMTFDIRDNVSIAQTTYPSYESYHITFSSQYINENGWNKILLGDNIGYDWNKVQTTEEALVIVVAHEAQHANHVARFYDAVKEAKNDAGGAVALLQDWGYSQEYIDIFFRDENGKWGYTSDDEMVNKMHNYMRKYNYGVLDKALEEYRNDYKH